MRVRRSLLSLRRAAVVQTALRSCHVSGRRNTVMQEPASSVTRRWTAPRLPNRHLVVRLIAAAIAVVVFLQAVTIAVLTLVDMQRRRRSGPAVFPHNELPEVSVEGNMLQIYTYGRDVYDAMLEAIDSATDSIYFETFIWKDDVVGREFKEHLARRADDGVAVYVVFDV